MKRHEMIAHAIVILGLLGGGAVHGDVIHVPAEQPTIQAAIDVAQDGDEIVLADGTYVGSGNKILSFPGTPTLTIRSESGNRDACVIDCEGSGRFALLGAGDTISVQSLTVVNGDVGLSQGGGMWSAGILSITDCVFQDCTSQRGGGVYADGGALIVDGCSFTGNTASSAGGGLRIVGGGTLTCTNSSFTGNLAQIGGAGLLANQIDPSSLIADCTFQGNEAGLSGNGGGGGLAITSQDAYLVERCLFEGNIATFGAGVLVRNNVNGGARIRGCVISNNTASWGGGVAVESSTEFVNCLIVGNIAAGGKPGFPPAGGGLTAYVSSTATMINCTFTGNSTEDLGGAINAGQDGHVDLINCVLWQDDAPSGAEIYIGYPGWDGGSVTVSTSDVAGGQAGIAICCSGAVNWGAGNIEADPLLDEHGCLAAGSPALDAGVSAAVPLGVLDDIDGRQRFVDGDGNGTAVVDMGACEFQTCAADIDRNDDVDFVDLLNLLAAWGPYEPCPPAIAEDLDHDCEVGLTDLLALLAAWGSCP